MPDAEPTSPGTQRPGSQSTGANYVVELPYAEELQAMLEGRYVVEGFLGQGGMGAVYKGLQMPLRRPVAIKILAKREAGDDFAFEERFKREAYAMASLTHPNIVQVYDCGDAGESFLFISMELVEGGDLSDAIKHGQITPEVALKLAPQICDGLQAAHDRGIVHRDIKPANIFLTADGRAKVADFGLAKKFDVQSTFATRTGLGMGTPDYAAPEQYEGSSDIDQRADIYALGVMMYQMLTGKLPRGMAEPPSVLVPGLDPRLDAVVQKAMRQDRDLRYQSAREVRAALMEVVSPRGSATTTAAAASPPRSATSTSTPAAVKRPPTRAASEAPVPPRPAAPARKSSAAVPVLMTLALLAGGAVWWFLTQESPKPAAVLAEDAVTTTTAPPAVKAPSTPPPSSPPANKSSVDAATPASPSPKAASEPTPVAMSKAATPVSGESAPAPSAPPSMAADPVGAPPLPNPAAPVPPLSPPPSTGLDQRLSTLKQGFDAAVERDAGAAFKSGMATLNKGYTGALDRSLAAATQAGKLDEVLALKEEKESIEKGQGVPSESEESAQPAGKLPDTLKALRKTYRSSAAQHEATKASAMLPLYEKYDQALAQVQTELTKASKLEDALRVKSLRDQLATERGAVSPAPVQVAAVPAMPPSPAAASAAVPVAKTGGREEPATKEKPFINSLGMKFVPVKDTNVLFCIHETRYKDYAAYAAEAKGVEPQWKDQAIKGFTPTERADEHPVNKVNWTQVKAFCAWLSAKEGKTYRLATDREWSIAVGIGREEKWGPETTPDTVNRVPDEFPWGQEWPPPRRFGNYADESLKEKKLMEEGFRFIEDYDDGFPTTAPVMSFKPNKFGLYDLSGNVWEWVEDWGSDKKNSRVYRGSCWNTGISSYMYSSGRLATGDYYRSDILGFRVVLELPAAAAKGS